MTQSDSSSNLVVFAITSILAIGIGLFAYNGFNDEQTISKKKSKSVHLPYSKASKFTKHDHSDDDDEDEDSENDILSSDDDDQSETSDHILDDVNDVDDDDYDEDEQELIKLDKKIHRNKSYKKKHLTKQRERSNKHTGLQFEDEDEIILK